MKIAILGTGMVGRTLAGRLSGLGHEVRIGTRDVAETLARTEPDMMGNPPFAAWAADHPIVPLVTFAEAAAGADLVVNATSGHGAIPALSAAGADGLAGAGGPSGMIVMDISNPLDFSAGFPPTLFVKDDDCLGERIQRAFPATRVVKTLNTMTAHLMVAPGSLAGGEHTVFVSGDDADAKATVSGLLAEMGWTDIIDLGGIETARGTEMILPIWLRLMGALGTASFNFKVVR